MGSGNTAEESVLTRLRARARVIAFTNVRAASMIIRVTHSQVAWYPVGQRSRFRSRP
jgi:hypothetical protein